MVTSGGSLTTLQKRVLAALDGIEPPFGLPLLIEARLRENGLRTSILRSSPAFVQLRVTDLESVVIVDLIAEAGDHLEPPLRHHIGQVTILVDAPQAILAEKLCALLERSELRDLLDVEALVRAGHDLVAAISNAPRRDSGFSPLTLAWLLRDWDVQTIASSLGMDDATAARLHAFRQVLIDRLITQAT